jgi:hypothetical protein
MSFPSNRIVLPTRTTGGTDPVDLITPFHPCGVYFSDSDRYEILTRDCATVAHQVAGSDVYFLKDMRTGEIVGMGLDHARATFK